MSVPEVMDRLTQVDTRHSNWKSGLCEEKRDVEVPKVRGSAVIEVVRRKTSVPEVISLAPPPSKDRSSVCERKGKRLRFEGLVCRARI